MAQIPARSLEWGSGGSRRVLVVAAGSGARGEGFFRTSREVVFFVADHDGILIVYRNRGERQREKGRGRERVCVCDSVLLVRSTVVKSKAVMLLSHTWSQSRLRRTPTPIQQHQQSTLSLSTISKLLHSSFFAFQCQCEHCIVIVCLFHF